MFNNKSGQVSDTTTWIVATMVILVLLGVSIFITSGIAKVKTFGGDKVIEGKQRDHVAEKTISAFLLNNGNLDLIKNSVSKNNYSDLKVEIKNLLLHLPRIENKSGWNFQLFVDEDFQFEVITQKYLGNLYVYYPTTYKIEDKNKKILLRFWEEHFYETL